MIKEEELAAAKNNVEKLEKENSRIAAELAKREQELDLRNQEKVLCILYRDLHSNEFDTTK